LLSGSKPENRPSRSSESRKLLADQRRGVGVGDDVLLEVQLVVEHVLDQAAEERDVVPERSGTCRSAIALVRVNRGSMWIDLAPARLGLAHPLEAHRVALGHVRTLDDDAVGVREVCWEFVAPPRPNEAPRPGTVAECYMRAWFSIWIAPRAL
jgi:hypothetical protein